MHSEISEGLLIYKTMKKDAYYFPHYSNARNDSKLLKLRRVLGVEGYGIYFMLLELLREQTDFKLPIKVVEELEFDLRVSKEKIISVITNFELFDVDAEFFFSPKLVFYLQPYIESSERARVAANLRWSKVKGLNANADANAMLLECKSECKESKGEESKVKDINNNIDIRKLKFADTLKPFVEKYGKEMVRKFYDYWTEPNKSNTKFRQELQKTWDTKRRLGSWNPNNFDAKKPVQTYNHDNSGLI